jgi:hypothetical protein
MTDTAHIFTPQDDSLEARIDAYKSVYEAWFNAEASLKFLDDEEWSDTLGDREEVEQAHKISVRSLEMATSAIKKSEISQARKQGLLSDDVAQELTHTKRQQEMKDIRDSQQASDSSEHRRL